MGTVNPAGIFLNTIHKVVKHVHSHPKIYVALALLAFVGLLLATATGVMGIVGAHASWAPRFMCTLNTALSLVGDWSRYTITGISAGGVLATGTFILIGITCIAFPPKRIPKGSVPDPNTVSGAENAEFNFVSDSEHSDETKKGQKTEDSNSEMSGLMWESDISHTEED